VLKRSWAGEVRNVSLLVAIGVNAEGYREILRICEGAKEDKAGWSGFLKHLKERGLMGVRLIISDACIGLAESAAEFFPDAAWQMHRTLVSQHFQPCPVDHGAGDRGHAQGDPRR
jgi:transposase-like protein